MTNALHDAARERRVLRQVLAAVQGRNEVKKKKKAKITAVFFIIFHNIFHISYFTDNPFASGSFGQGFRGTYH